MVVCNSALVCVLDSFIFILMRLQAFVTRFLYFYKYVIDVPFYTVLMQCVSCVHTSRGMGRPKPGPDPSRARANEAEAQANLYVNKTL